MTRIILIRHGEVPGITPPRFRGRANLQLTERGLQQARATAAHVVSRWHAKLVYTSPLQRCIDTGRAIGRAADIPCFPLEDLNDLDYGDWQNKTHEEVRMLAPADYARWHETPQRMQFPSGESLQDLARRAADVLRFVLAEHAEETLILVGHDSINRALLLEALDMPLSGYWRLVQDPCGISEVLLTANGGTLVRLNETVHL